MRRVRVYQVDVFTRTRFEGNPAGVVLDADVLSATDMQRIAGELGNSETAFVLRPDGPDHDVRVRFFTPTTEVPSCGHATIAAHFVWAQEHSLRTCRLIQKIGAGILPVDIVQTLQGYEVVMTQGAAEFGEPFAVSERDDILDAMSMKRGHWDARCPVQVVSTGHSKVLVGVRSLEALHALRPDSERLASISHTIRCNGFFAFVLTDGPYLAHGRMFAPAIGIREDPATGNANGPLGAYLVRHGFVDARDGELCFEAIQGETMGRPGVVKVMVEIESGEPRKVRVAGAAVIVFRAEMAW